MKAIPCIAIFDVGKTNKKLFLFNENYEIIFEQAIQIAETADEDGFSCEDLESLRRWLLDALEAVSRREEFDIKAVNFSAYGASFVYINEEGRAIPPLYNYLKPYPASLQKKFYDNYGGEKTFSFQTASPVLGSLNSGLQLYRVKYENPTLFAQIKYALHLPQYLSYLITGKTYSDITSIGCHTGLWDFAKNDYHDWVKQEGIYEKLAPLHDCTQTISAAFAGNNYRVGVGLHDSSAALIPYLMNFNEPFILLSTGTWCISLHPFNHTPLTEEELAHDCLCYLQYQGKPVKASRLFAGHEHEQQVKRIAAHFNQDIFKYRNMLFDPQIISRLKQENNYKKAAQSPQEISSSNFEQRELANFSSDSEAYHQLMMDIMEQQKASLQWVLKGSPVKRIFVDGGFSKNSIYMHLLAAAYPGMEVFAASMSQATALGAALCIHPAWNKRSIPNDMIGLRYYHVITNISAE